MYSLSIIPKLAFVFFGKPQSSNQDGLSQRFTGSQGLMTAPQRGALLASLIPRDGQVPKPFEDGASRASVSNNTIRTIQNILDPYSDQTDLNDQRQRLLINELLAAEEILIERGDARHVCLVGAGPAATTAASILAKVNSASPSGEARVTWVLENLSTGRTANFEVDADTFKPVQPVVHQVNNQSKLDSKTLSLAVGSMRYPEESFIVTIAKSLDLPITTFTNLDTNTLIRYLVVEENGDQYHKFDTLENILNPNNKETVHLRAAQNLLESVERYMNEARDDVFELQEALESQSKQGVISYGTLLQNIGKQMIEKGRITQSEFDVAVGHFRQYGPGGLNVCAGAGQSQLCMGSRAVLGTFYDTSFKGEMVSISAEMAIQGMRAKALNSTLTNIQTLDNQRVTQIQIKGPNDFTVTLADATGETSNTPRVQTDITHLLLGVSASDLNNIEFLDENGHDISPRFQGLGARPEDMFKGGKYFIRLPDSLAQKLPPNTNRIFIGASEVGDDVSKVSNMFFKKDEASGVCYAILYPWNDLLQTADDGEVTRCFTVAMEKAFDMTLSREEREALKLFRSPWNRGKGFSTNGYALNSANREKGLYFTGSDFHKNTGFIEGAVFLAVASALEASI